MDVQEFLDQERRGEKAPIARKFPARNAMTKNLLRQQRYIGAFAADTERRARAASKASEGVLGLSEMLWRANERSRGFQKLGNDLTRSAIGISNAVSKGGFQKLGDDLTRSAVGISNAVSKGGFQKLGDDLTRSAVGISNAVSETMRVSEAYHRMMDPIPALKSALGLFTAISPAFDSTRYVTPLAKLDRQVGFLRDHSFSRLADLRSTAFETMRNISTIVDLVKPFGKTPLFQTGSVAGEYVDLAEVVHYADTRFASTAATPEIGDLLRAMENLACEMATSRAEAKSQRTIALATLWVAVLTLIWAVLCRYGDEASKQNNAAPIPILHPQASPSPSPAKPDVSTPDPAPKGRLV